jgi:hypothetical protein
MFHDTIANITKILTSVLVNGTNNLSLDIFLWKLSLSKISFSNEIQ